MTHRNATVTLYNQVPVSKESIIGVLGVSNKHSDTTESLQKMSTYFNPFPNHKFFNFSKPTEFADDNFEFDENGIKFYKKVENTVGKGKIDRYKQFLLF